MHTRPVRWLFRFASVLGLTLAASFLSAEDRKAPPPPPPPTLEGIGAELDDLEKLVAHWEKEIAGGGVDAKQRASAYQQLLLKAGRIAGQIGQLRATFVSTRNSMPKNDPTGGKTVATGEKKTENEQKLDALEERLKAVRERIDALGAPATGKDGDAGRGPAPGKTVVTPSAGDAKK